MRRKLSGILDPPICRLGGGGGCARIGRVTLGVEVVLTASFVGFHSRLESRLFSEMTPNGARDDE